MARPWVWGYAIGIVVGALFGAFWAESAARQLPAAMGVAYDVTTVIMVVAIGAGAIRLVRMARHAAPTPPDAVRAIGQRRVWRGAGWLWMLLVVAEALVIGRVTNLLVGHHLQEYVLAALAVIVGLHFFPLARIFHAPEQMMSAIPMTLVGCVAIVAMAAGYDLGEPARWNIVIGTVCAAALWSTCVRGLRQSGTC